jgi:YfiH family protein
VSLRHDEWLSGPAGRARLVITDRLGGASHPPYDEANLGAHVGDRPDEVVRNRTELARTLGLPPDRLLFMSQVHGAAVVQVDGPHQGPPPEADAMVTATRGLGLSVLVADCVPVLLCDPDAGVVGVTHAGRPGLAAGVVLRAVEAMRDLGARRVTARLGPSVCRRCYEVPAAMRADVAGVAPVAFAVDRHGRPALDIAAGVLAQLATVCEQVDQLPGCTRESPELFSHRRDGVTGRFGGFALLWGPEPSVQPAADSVATADPDRPAR